MVKKTNNKKEPETIKLVEYSTDRPANPCHNCKEDRWWQRPDGGWVCGGCHPDPAKLAEEWEKEHKE